MPDRTAAAIRILAFSTSLLAMAAGFDRASAQTPTMRHDSEFYSLEQPDPNSRIRMSFTQQIIYERAIYRAQQRVARSEARKWAGQSLLRPTYDSQAILGTPIWYTNTVSSDFYRPVHSSGSYGR